MERKITKDEGVLDIEYKWENQGDTCEKFYFTFDFQELIKNNDDVFFFAMARFENDKNVEQVDIELTPSELDQVIEDLIKVRNKRLEIVKSK